MNLGNYFKRIIRSFDASKAASEAPEQSSQDITVPRIEPPPTLRRTTLTPCDQLCAITDMGRARTHNEDQVRVCADPCNLIVADGMGGHLFGDVASALAAGAVEEHLAADRDSLASSDVLTVEDSMLASFDAAQARVLAAGWDQEPSCQMGATLILGIIRDDQLFTCHVGDVRCYVWHGGELSALTRDHSVVAELVAAGRLSAEQAHLHAAKHQVLQAIGMPVGFNPELNRCPLEVGDRVLLCSDGLWEMLSKQEIAGIVGAEGSMLELSTQLVDRANDAGGRDNISVILYEHRAPGGAAPCVTPAGAE